MTVDAFRAGAARPGKSACRARLLGVATVASLAALTTPALAQTCGAATMSKTDAPPPTLTRDDVRMVAPALDRYAQERLQGDLWRRPDLSPRDRQPGHALGPGRAQPDRRAAPLRGPGAGQRGQPGEVSELVTHLAFYAGWGNGMSAVAVVKDVFARRGIGADQLPPATPELLPLDEVVEAQRAARVRQDVGAVVPGLEQFTTDVLFRDLWLRPGLAPRDRSLVTVSALIAAGHVAQVPYHLSRAMDNGLTRAQAAEAVAHLAFYAGWPNAFSAVPAVRGVFEGRRS